MNVTKLGVVVFGSIVLTGSFFLFGASEQSSPVAESLQNSAPLSAKASGSKLEPARPQPVQAAPQALSRLAEGMKASSAVASRSTARDLGLEGASLEELAELIEDIDAEIDRDGLIANANSEEPNPALTDRLTHLLMKRVKVFRRRVELLTEKSEELRSRHS